MRRPVCAVAAGHAQTLGCPLDEPGPPIKSARGRCDETTGPSSSSFSQCSFLSPLLYCSTALLSRSSPGGGSSVPLGSPAPPVARLRVSSLSLPLAPSFLCLAGLPVLLVAPRLGSFTHCGRMRREPKSRLPPPRVPQPWDRVILASPPPTPPPVFLLAASPRTVGSCSHLPHTHPPTLPLPASVRPPTWPASFFFSRELPPGSLLVSPPPDQQPAFVTLLASA